MAWKLTKLFSRSLLVFPSSNPQQIEWNLAKKKWTLCWGFSSCLFFFKPPIRSRSPLLTGSRLISLPLATQMFQFAKFEKSKERRLATELGYGFPIGDPWITDGISPWPFASESVLPSQCPGIHPMHSFRSCTKVHWRPTQSRRKKEKRYRIWSDDLSILSSLMIFQTFFSLVIDIKESLRNLQILRNLPSPLFATLWPLLTISKTKNAFRSSHIRSSSFRSSRQTQEMGEMKTKRYPIFERTLYWGGEGLSLWK